MSVITERESIGIGTASSIPHIMEWREKLSKQSSSI